MEVRSETGLRGMEYQHHPVSPRLSYNQLNPYLSP